MAVERDLEERAEERMEGLLERTLGASVVVSDTKSLSSSGWEEREERELRATRELNSSTAGLEAIVGVAWT